MKRFLDQFDPEGHEDIIGGALNFLKKHLNELEDKLNFWKVDPQFWSLDIEVMRNTLFYIESQRMINPNSDHKPNPSLIRGNKLHSSRFDASPSASKSDDISWDRQSEISKNGLCTCDHDAEMDSRHLKDRQIISDLRKRVIALNESTAECLMESVANDRIMVDMQETISRLQDQIKSQENKCQTHISIIQGLQAKVSSLESSHLKEMFSTNSFNNELDEIEDEDEEEEEEEDESSPYSLEESQDICPPLATATTIEGQEEKSNQIIEDLEGEEKYYSVPSKSKTDFYLMAKEKNEEDSVEKSLRNLSPPRDFSFAPLSKKFNDCRPTDVSSRSDKHLNYFSPIDEVKSNSSILPRKVKPLVSRANRDDVYPSSATPRSDKYSFKLIDDDGDDCSYAPKENTRENSSPASNRISTDGEALPSLHSIRNPSSHSENCFIEKPTDDIVRSREDEDSPLENKKDYFPGTRLSRINYHPMSSRNKLNYLSSMSRDNSQSNAFK